jgi:Arc/MetJ-type ribon-helix-helix transcriptional regulator
MPVGNYKGVSLKEELVHRIKIIICQLGTYHSVAEFVSEAVRLRLEVVEKQCKSEEGKAEVEVER